ncbi:MAG TPA: F0F1 ATP synthase subunit gamma [Candidatus Saccharimonadales bacterium]|nr:F0F1 ATP synthase subunit gamma [Candidatus Saccharimonadales bacterium]
MRRPNEIASEEASMGTLVELTSVFEGLASMRISQIKDQVLQSTKFYSKLWDIYSQIRVTGSFSFGRGHGEEFIDKELLVIITAEGGFSGDIDLKLVKLMLKDYDPKKNDIIVVGHHGATQLSQNKVAYKIYFKMPSRDRDINVEPIVREIKKYRSTKVYYQEYISLMVQDVKRIELSSAVNNLGDAQVKTKEEINEKTYIFEPSTFDVIAHLESSMMQITVSQLILESKLAQYASRFQAMRMAHDRADETTKTLHLDYNRSKRNIKDARLKEIVTSLKLLKEGTAA